MSNAYTNYESIMIKSCKRSFVHNIHTSIIIIVADVLVAFSNTECPSHAATVQIRVEPLVWKVLQQLLNIIFPCNNILVVHDNMKRTTIGSKMWKLCINEMTIYS